MKTKILAGSILVAALSVVGNYAYQYQQVRHPAIEATDGGWNFTYDLCIPAPRPLPCVPVTKTFYIPKGDSSAILPVPRRLKSVETIEDAKEEAEKIADMNEGKYRGNGQ